MTAWKPRSKKWDWRAFLTADERRLIADSDAAAREIEKLQDAYRKKFTRARMMVVNRAIQRAKYSSNAVAEMEGR